jgi:LysR family transcriptional regulator, glycine cleavage system transcriptional activator
VKQFPPLHCLLAFESLARLKNGIQAAEELCITPSAVSHRIKQLESILGASLFIDNQYTLTPEGENCLNLVKQALTTLAKLPHAAQPDKGSRKKLRIAVTPTFARQLLMPKLPLFRLAYPDIELVLQVAVPLAVPLAAAPFSPNKASQADLEIRFGSGLYTDVQSTCLLRDQVTPACSPALATELGPFNNFKDIAVIQRSPLIRSSLEPWSTWFQAYGIGLSEPSDGDQYNDVGMVLEAAAAGYGVALLRLKLGQAWLESGKLVRISSDSVEPSNQHYLCWQTGALERWECSAFFDWVIGTFN